ncbi:hydrogenase nickel incorporation protein HypB [Celerinatantimonas sp. YJH-8]|uniref:hydrogenase nickel incorporation protein HypB n=1 Tax=Celerinatantimonas sp. YJH-8 TaxID=3228714 RepID=UPI0038C610AF
MCSTCGCSEGDVTITPTHESNHDHDHTHDHQHPHAEHEHEHAHSHNHHHDEQAASTIIVHHHYYHQGDVHHHIHYHVEGNIHDQPERLTTQPAQPVKRSISIEEDVLAKNNHIAAHNREHFAALDLAVLNFVSSPGSGKTTLLCETLKRFLPLHPCAVIEGDQQTQNDANRIDKTGAQAIQINTGKGCHLDAQMVHDALHQLETPEHSYLFIENVGNLVCPASFDLGEKHKVAVLSVTEGEDKPLKYPHMFAAASLLLINKIDLLEYVDFDLARCMQYAHQVNPELTIIPVSATTGAGMDEWLTWLEAQLCA